MSANQNDVMVFNGSLWIPTTATYPSGYFGDGIQGPIHYTVNTTLTADVRGTSIIVDAGVTLRTAGFELCGNLWILNNGTVSDAGADAVGAVPGQARSPDCSALVSGGQGGSRGGSGGNMLFSAAFLTPVSGTFESSVCGAGGNGGSGGGIGANNSGLFTSTFERSPLLGPNPTDFFGIFLSIGEAITVGCGGGGGNASVGGTGGAGGGINRVRAPYIINNGVITARGGNGSAATGTNGSGGGGGSAGRNIIVGARYGSGTYVVSGGTGGAGNGTGTAGAAGAAGFNHFYG